MGLFMAEKREERLRWFEEEGFFLIWAVRTWHRRGAKWRERRKGV